VPVCSGFDLDNQVSNPLPGSVGTFAKNNSGAVNDEQANQRAKLQFSMAGR